MADKKALKEKKTEERREKILKSAVNVFTSKGYEAATIPEIAREAGVAAGTIYLYFPNKRELFVAVVKSAIFTVPLLDLIGKIPTGNFEEVFKKILLDRFDLIKSETVARMPRLISEVLRDPELKELWLKDFLYPFLHRMEMAFRMLSVTGKVRRMEPEVAVRMVGGMIFGFLMLKMIEGPDGPLNKIPDEKVAENIANFVLYGMVNDKGAKKDGKK